MSKDILFAGGDGHTASSVGLIARKGSFNDAGQPIGPSLHQLWLLDVIEDLERKVKALYRRGDHIHVVLNGDVLDQIKKSNQLWTTNTATAIQAAVDVWETFRDMCNGGFFVVRGTEAHVGGAGELEESFAKQIRATRWPLNSPTVSTFVLPLTIQGVRIQCLHHGKAGRMEHTLANAGGTVASQAVLVAARHGWQPPHVAIRSHVHVAYDTHDDYPVRVMQLPALQLATAHGHKVAPGTQCHIGGAVCTIEDGRFDGQIYKYWTKEPEAWDPEISLLQPTPPPSKRR